jgi:branched-chain amino acid transport system ATP-binding protein
MSPLKSTGAAKMLELRSVNAAYGNIPVLHDLSLRIDQGEIIALIGANGAGKSTALMTICGVVPARSGEILFQGRPIHGLPPDKIVALGISQVPEGRRIFPALSVAENLDMGAFLRRDKPQVRRDLEHCCSLFPILAERRHQLGGNLSGGEQQMLAISRALMARPKLLLLDEPSMGLAPLITRQIFEIIRKINKEDGTTVLLVEQNAHLALKTADRGYVIENGRIVLHGTAEQLLSNQAIQKAYLGM